VLPLKRRFFRIAPFAFTYPEGPPIRLEEFNGTRTDAIRKPGIQMPRVRADVLARCCSRRPPTPSTWRCRNFEQGELGTSSEARNGHHRIASKPHQGQERLRSKLQQWTGACDIADQRTPHNKGNCGSRRIAEGALP
jgi:hypothetical protein